MEHYVWKEKLFEAVAGLGEEGCAADYVHPATVVLTATPDTGYSFGSWGNCPSAVSNVCTIASISASRTNGP